jgi:hypothetical protein
MNACWQSALIGFLSGMAFMHFFSEGCYWYFRRRDKRKRLRQRPTSDPKP